MNRPLRPLLVLTLLAAGLAGLPAHAQLTPLPSVPEPAENPLTAEKAVLGKILFWDQQLSTDNTVACGTCHSPADGGMDPVLAAHPGADGVFGNADDLNGSFGVARRDVSGLLISDPVFGFDVQVTGRAAPNFFGGLWGPESFWDGRAGDAFIDPLTGSVAIATGGSLESQALGPILSDVEMAKEGRTWDDVVSRLEFAPPLGLATNWPADVVSAIAADGTYSELFEAAFGDSAITPVRMAFAIASYERTLVADQTPFDDFVAGDNAALSLVQQQGLQFFVTSPCATCHALPTFSDNSYRTLGVRSPAEDDGRQSVTGNLADRGSFKVPTLRNLGLKPSFMHTGEFTTLPEVITFYQPGNQALENLDPLMPVPVPPLAVPSLIAFLDDGLTDPRVATETGVFARPTPVPEPGFGIGVLTSGIALGLCARIRRRSRT